MTAQNITRRNFLRTSCIAFSGAAAGLGTQRLMGQEKATKIQTRAVRLTVKHGPMQK